MTYKKKLIEVSLPLEAINFASAREKSIRHGHPSTLHLWWARRPLAAARAVIFAQMVDDPSTYVDVLKSNPKVRKKAEAVLSARLKVWTHACELAEKTKGTSLVAPEPGPSPTLDSALADIERERLFKIIEELVKWENTNDEKVLQIARDEIWQSWRRTCAINAGHSRVSELFLRDKLPEFHDPFAGGGALPLEAQRLGLVSNASDLNPVPVMINKAMIEIPSKFSGMPPVNSDRRKMQFGEQAMTTAWVGAQGLAEDVRYYGDWIRNEAEKRIGHLYPKLEVTLEMANERKDLEKYVGQKLTVIAWIWARTVKSPNPAFANVDVPLASTFMLSTKAGKEAYIEPIIENNGYRFKVNLGKPTNSEEAKNGTKLARANFICLMSGEPISGDYIKSEGKAGRIGKKMLAVIAEGERGKIYVGPTDEMEKIAEEATPSFRPDVQISGTTQYLGTKLYGIDTFSKLFTDRQLVALTTFSDLVEEVRGRIKEDAIAAGLSDKDQSINGGDLNAAAYADGVSVYLAFAVDRYADYWTAFGRWQGANQQLSNMFGRQAIAMVWDYPEANPFSGKGGSAKNLFEWTVQSIENIGKWGPGFSTQEDAAIQKISKNKVVSTDPPYYDNVPYADLSDFFYVWMRRALKTIYPDLFSTMAVPKSDELVAFAYRHDGKEGAEKFFLNGMTQAMHRIAEQSHPAFPVTIYYAFKQSESDANADVASTGWETFLDAVISAGFALTGTWPMRTEMAQRMRGVQSNALATSIVIVCRPKDIDALSATRREFISALKSELPQALAHLQAGNIAPVDLAQAAIGPGMAVYTRYSKVLDSDGKPLSVRAALSLINQLLDEALAEQEGDFDAETRWALTWFDQLGFSEGEYGVAEQLATSKNTAVAGLVAAGILISKAGKVRVLKPEELDDSWSPAGEKRLTIWEIVHQLIRVLEKDGENAAAKLVFTLGVKAETARELCYRLYTLCERRKRATEAMSYNGLVQSWPEITRLANEKPATVTVGTTDMFEKE